MINLEVSRKVEIYFNLEKAKNSFINEGKTGDNFYKNVDVKVIKSVQIRRIQVQINGNFMNIQVD